MAKSARQNNPAKLIHCVKNHHPNKMRRYFTRGRFRIPRSPCVETSPDGRCVLCADPDRRAFCKELYVHYKRTHDPVDRMRFIEAGCIDAPCQDPGHELAMYLALEKMLDRGWTLEEFALEFPRVAERMANAES